MNATACGRPTAPGNVSLQQVQAAADAAGEIGWDISVDSTIVHVDHERQSARTH
ncbi:hypothetical protein Shyd_73030 [Streptomyces hydrogenans]|uniref:Uncharacterized protein n=1 Tax=Streptomyces hydrogenans TaxID=1873719 RepID=A0ABQ3PLP0_9ACTN|nr:hypothetical protein Shyd_73030 [Streptomyces hydrogenans]